MKKVFIIIYCLFLLIVTVFSYAFIDPNLSYLQNIYTGFHLQQRTSVTIVFVCLLLMSFFCYGSILFLHHKKVLSKKDCIRLIVGTAVVLVFSYPAILSYDMFNYLATARVTYHYRENPYIVMPIEFLADPTFAFTRATNKTALYGPVWIMLTALPFVLSFGNFLLGLFAMKAFIAVWYVLAVWLVYRISNSSFTALLFGLHPLVVFEALVSGHNDIVMIALVLAAYVFLSKKKFVKAFVLLCASILIKYATVILIPVFLFIAWRMLHKKHVDWHKMYFISGVLLFGVFLLSPLREELYPWYAVWFVPFFLLSSKKYIIHVVTISFAAGLLFRYIPYMFTGNYFGSTPIIRIVLTILPFAILCLCGFLFRKHITPYFHYDKNN